MQKIAVKTQKIIYIPLFLPIVLKIRKKDDIIYYNLMKGDK